MKNVVGQGIVFFYFSSGYKLQSRGSELGSVGLAETQVFLFGLSNIVTYNNKVYMYCCYFKFKGKWIRQSQQL